MRGFGCSALVVVLVVAGCGGGGASSPSITEPSASSPTSTSVPVVTADRATSTTASVTPAEPSTVPSTPATTIPATTIPAQADHETAVLRGDGIGPFGFGTAAADVEAWANGNFGIPDWRVEFRPAVPWWPGQLRSVELDGDEMLFIRWANGLDLAFSDRSEFRNGSLHLAWWRYGAQADGTNLSTVDGFDVPGTTDEFMATYPTAAPWSLSCEGFTYDLFEVPPSAPIGAGLRGLHTTPPPSFQDMVTELSAGAPWRCPPTGSPDPLPSRPGALLTGLQLDGSGLSGIPFGTPIDEVRAQLEPLLGPPNVVFTDTTSLPPDGGVRRGCYLAEHESTEMTWTSPQLTLWFHDGPTGESDGVVRFVYWRHELGDGTPVIATPAGARPGIAVGEVTALEPTLRLAPPGDCGCHRVLFDENGPMEITTDWNSTLDVQRFLVDHGYPIQITGEIDEPTTQATRDYLADLGLDEGFYCGCADFRTLDALGITVPAADAIVTTMSGGTAGRCDCGC